MQTTPGHCFVYGMLKRGQANHHLIEVAVRDVIPATVAGRLYDLGPFPALGPGADRVRGELLLIDPIVLAYTLTVLDELEGYQPSDPQGSIYVRRVVTAVTDEGAEIAANVYFYNRATDACAISPPASGQAPVPMRLRPSPVSWSISSSMCATFGADHGAGIREAK